MTESNESVYYDRSYQEIRASSVEDILRLHDRLGEYVFRGHGAAEWSLRTTFERAAEDVPPEKRAKLEQKVIVEFKRRAHHYLSDLPEKDRHLEWLALMQHYGCPTRLLDFTRSYFIALFFAVEDAGSDSSIWGVNRTFFEFCRGLSFSPDYLRSVYNEDAEERVDAILSPSIGQTQESGVVLAEPYRMNERLSIQQGLFLFPKNLEVSFEENLCSPLGARSLSELAQRKGTPIAVKIVIPKDLHLKIALFLHEANISAATLFPGLDGYARSQRLHIQSARLSIQQESSTIAALYPLLKKIAQTKRKPDDDAPDSPLPPP